MEILIKCRDSKSTNIIFFIPFKSFFKIEQQLIIKRIGLPKYRVIWERLAIRLEYRCEDINYLYAIRLGNQGEWKSTR